MNETVTELENIWRRIKEALREKIDDFIVYMDKHFCEECFYRFDNLFVMLKITMLL